VFVSDHGEMLGERQFRFSKYCLYDSSVRVPMILSGSYIPETRRGSEDERPAELIDLVPTLTKIAGLEANPLLPGLDLFGEIKRKGTFCEFHTKNGSGQHLAPALMWRKQDWKLILYLPVPLSAAIEQVDQFQGELYHLSSDPQEWHNLYKDQSHSSIREKLTVELLMHLASTWTRGPFFYDKHDLQALR
jgi:arylsulfatase A-like enzyme